MSLKWIVWALEEAKTDSPTETLVLVVLAESANPRGYTWPSKKRLAHFTRLDERSVRRIIVRLQDKGLVEVTERFRPNGSNTSNGYLLKREGKSDIPPYDEDDDDGGEGDTESPPVFGGNGHRVTPPSDRESPPEPRNKNQVQTTRSSTISEDDLDEKAGGQPAPANDAGASDPQSPTRKTLIKPAAMPTIPRATPSKFVKKDEGQGRGKSSGGENTSPLAGPRPIILALETKLKKMIPDTERKNLCASRKLAWMGHEANGESPADLYDRDPRFATYMDWMVDQAIAADLGAIKTLVGMLRNHNRGSKEAPGKIAGWWMWELQHPPVGSEAATVDPSAIDFNGPWVFDRNAVPPRPDLYVWAWDEVMQDGRKAFRWYKAGDVQN